MRALGHLEQVGPARGSGREGYEEQGGDNRCLFFTLIVRP